MVLLSNFSDLLNLKGTNTAVRVRLPTGDPPEWYEHPPADSAFHVVWNVIDAYVGSYGGSSEEASFVTNIRICYRCH